MPRLHAERAYEKEACQEEYRYEDNVNSDVDLRSSALRPCRVSS
jgi:hypothetical protein